MPIPAMLREGGGFLAAAEMPAATRWRTTYCRTSSPPGLTAIMSATDDAGAIRFFSRGWRVMVDRRPPLVGPGLRESGLPDENSICRHAGVVLSAAPTLYPSRLHDIRADRAQPPCMRAVSLLGRDPCRVRCARNEDSYVDRPDLGLWAVADGAGGHQAGDVASQIVTDTLKAIPPGLGASALLAEVRQRLADAHNVLLAEAARRGRHAMLVSTVVVLLARDDSTLVYGPATRGPICCAADGFAN